ncbi:hypothetical protein [Parvibaculum sp.]|uniref:hypothetical protein n=1 Tax=Parvibaculum sp. TaxID=2024848 RepID=UPI00320C4BA4
MPETPKILLIVCAALEAVVGLLMLAAPGRFLARMMPGMTPGLDAISVSRLAGSALLSLGALAWFARDITDPAALKPVLVALLVYNVLAMVNLFYQGAKIDSGAYVPGAAHLILSVALVYYLRLGA